MLSDLLIISLEASMGSWRVLVSLLIAVAAIFFIYHFLDDETSELYLSIATGIIGFVAGIYWHHRVNKNRANPTTHCS
jgi:hypothetical protein